MMCIQNACYRLPGGNPGHSSSQGQQPVMKILVLILMIQMLVVPMLAYIFHACIHAYMYACIHTYVHIHANLGTAVAIMCFLLCPLQLFQLLDKPWSQVSSLFPPGWFLPPIFIAHRVQQSHCSSIIACFSHKTHALELSASQFEHKKKSHEFIRVCTRGGSNSQN